MSFEFYFEEQLKKHPSMQFSDAVKLCYQAAMGAEHLLTPSNVLLYQLIWLIPGFLITEWTRSV